MDKDQIIDILRQNEEKLHQMGVKHAGLFGSLARGEADERSDIDIAISLDAGSSPVMTIYDFVGIKQFIENLFSCKVDIIDRDWVKPFLKQRIETDLIDAF
jgi:predicted nucleotidyltransferase